mmetsp:Transcript_67331/g.190882  ORF Transcript_67331/g.190882 Transcript_67331/m.190882 type:complete len:306 (+) Transcript_67331:1-918(+)
MQKSRAGARALLRAQGLLHGSDSVLLPLALLLSAGGLIFGQHMISHETGRHSIRTFLAKILASMLPLVVLERKLVSCSDPVRLFSRFSTKVLLMHGCFLGLRLGTATFPGVHYDQLRAAALFFAAACALLLTVFKFRPTPGNLWEHRGVFLLFFLAMAMAVAEVALTTRGFWLGDLWKFPHVRRAFTGDLMSMGSGHVELLAFVPAVWMAYRQDAGGVPTDADIRESQKRAVCLFAFVMAFYVPEDLLNAQRVRARHPLAAAGHIAHYLLLLDFAAFLLAHLYDPEKFAKLRGALLSFVADISAV